MLLHLQAGALLLTEAGVDAAAGEDDGDAGEGDPGGLAAVAVLVAPAFAPHGRHVGRRHLKTKKDVETKGKVPTTKYLHM